MSKRKQHRNNDVVFPESSTRMRKDDVVSYASNSRFYFFIRMLNEPVIYLPASPWDTIMSIHERVELITGIPVVEQRLIYKGKQLQWEQTLGECHVGKDVQVYLVGRMRSTGHPKAWLLINSLVERIVRFVRSNLLERPQVLLPKIKLKLTEFLKMSLQATTTAQHMQMFNALCAPLALVMLYVQADDDSNKKEAAEHAIRHFVTHGMDVLPKREYYHFVPIVLEFCRLLNERAGCYDKLYLDCRRTLVTLLEKVELGQKRSGWLHDLFLFVSELAVKVCKDLRLSVESVMVQGPVIEDVADLSAMLGHVKVEIEKDAGFSDPFEPPLCKKLNTKQKGIAHVIITLHRIFVDLLSNLDKCLVKIEELVGSDMRQLNVTLPSGSRSFLRLLKELHGISQLYRGCNKMFSEVMKRSKHALCYLLLKYAKKTENHQWITEYKEASIFETRRHLAMLMLPGVKDEYDGLEMLIDRSQLLEESFEYVLHADISSLRAGLFMEFKNEEATGPGVLREWFLMVCQAIFNPQNGLFVACPNDRRRFYPNPASKVDPMHLDYFKFSGRIIALAFMHKLQVGILLDRVLIAQLAGQEVTLEDIKDADPYLYSSCKKILEMDPEVIDQDVLGLTFIDEVEELGERKSVKLCHDGENVVVNSANRAQYISSLIQHRFVGAISEQVRHFSQGFTDVVNGFNIQRSFFKLLHPEDLDLMLHGSENEISVEDWKAHTDYQDFNETDTQISWFWEVVGKMTGEQKKVLLYFWTSIKYLPMEGFSGLSSRLYIGKTLESIYCLPSSHTCFHQLCFPAYPCFEVMEARLSYISQDYVGCSFGMW